MIEFERRKSGKKVQDSMTSLLRADDDNLISDGSDKNRRLHPRTVICDRDLKETLDKISIIFREK